jgi:fucose permease
MNFNKKLVPVMLCFFTMGFVDILGVVKNHMMDDGVVSSSTAYMLASLVFFWFFIFSIPTSLLMNRIGRKRTVLLSLVITLVSMVIPIFGVTNLPMMLIFFSLLGIGNALMQTSLNPLVDVVMKGGASASTLTFGQFIKSICSLMAPLIASWGATQTIPSLGLDWRILFPIYLVIGIFATLLLFGTRIEEEPQPQAQKGIGRQFSDALALLVPNKKTGGAAVLLCFLAIVCHVGVDVGTNLTVPEILKERLNFTSGKADDAILLYFIFKMIGSFSGSFIMNYLKDWNFLLASILMMVVSAVGLLLGQTQWMLYVSIALMGYGNGNPFSIIFAHALQAAPEKKNEVSGLLIMGLIGGMVFPLFMGFASDAIGQIGAVLVMALGILYLLGYWMAGLRRK